MDIKETQINISGVIIELIHLFSKKLKNQIQSTLTESVLLQNINHQIKNWEKYVNSYTSYECITPLNIYDIDIINLILYLLKIYGKIADHAFTLNNQLFMESYTKFKDISIIYQNLAKINSEYSLDKDIKNILIRYPDNVTKMTGSILEFLDNTIIDYQISTIIN